MTRPAAPTLRAAVTAGSPLPVAMSRTRAPCLIPASSTRRSLTVLRRALEHRPPFLPSRRGHIPIAPLLVFETLRIKTLLGHGSGSVVSRFIAHLPADEPRTMRPRTRTSTCGGGLAFSLMPGLAARNLDERAKRSERRTRRAHKSWSPRVASRGELPAPFIDQRVTD